MHDGKPTVLFLGMHNAGRSQMAMGSGDACPVRDEIEHRTLALLDDLGVA